MDDFDEELTTLSPFVIPRQNRNQDLDDQDFPQPEFGIGIIKQSKKTATSY